MHRIQRRIYDHYISAYGHAPPVVPLPGDASWSPLVGNKEEYPVDIGAPLANRAPKRHVGDSEEPLRRKKAGSVLADHPASDMPEPSEGDRDERDERDMDDERDERDERDGEDDRDREDEESMATSRAGTSVGDRGERVERLHAIPAGAKQEFQPPPDEWTLDRERAEKKRGVKRERERSYDDEYARDRDSVRGGSPRSDVDDY